jgi:putative ABC transport system ATP-binding protein
METAIEFEAVTKRFPEPGGGSRTVLEGLSFACAAGGVMVVEGRSGTGKSTLLNLVAGLLVPDGGAVRAGGVDLGRLSEARRDRFRASHVGYIFQTFNLISPLTVLENVYLPGSLAGTGEATDRERAKEVLAELGLADQQDKLPFHLSVGQRQRVAVARAALRRPRILLADEPTANLDRESAEIVRATLERMRQEGSTLLIATHDPVLKGIEGAATLDLEKKEVRS